MQASQFRDIVYTHYSVNPREIEMPWREDHSPYHVLLSEIMLQQTQVSRVIEYFNTFVGLWPDISNLAEASLADVLFHWQGLGYNRRGKFLHACAREIVARYNAIIPSTYEELKVLSGIGDYTASAIMAFAYNEPVVVIETNIRRAIIYHFFEDVKGIHENDIREKIAYVLDEKNPRIWYWAFMDYGSHLSKVVENPNRRSKLYKKQSKFEGSIRQVRGAVLRILVGQSQKLEKEALIEYVAEDLGHHNEYDVEAIEKILGQLQHEGMIVSEEDLYYISQE